MIDRNPHFPIPNHIIEKGGTLISQGPVSLMVGTGGFYANLQPIQTIDNLSGSSTNVEIDQKEGTDMIFKITDSQNKVGYVQNIKVGGGDDSCLSSSSSSSSAASSAASSEASSSSSAVESSSEAAPAPVVVSCTSFLHFKAVRGDKLIYSLDC
jgi:hypothetical protein